jgi:oxygen-independent coproporphyrinogen-3 oxidase
LERILTTLQQQYSLSPQAEISMEADPGTFDLARLQQYKALGISRLSMWVQCFNQVCICILHPPTLGRNHSAHQHLEAEAGHATFGFVDVTC